MNGANGTGPVREPAELSGAGQLMLDAEAAIAQGEPQRAIALGTLALAQFTHRQAVACEIANAGTWARHEKMIALEKERMERIEAMMLGKIRVIESDLAERLKLIVTDLLETDVSNRDLVSATVVREILDRLVHAGIIDEYSARRLLSGAKSEG